MSRYLEVTESGPLTLVQDLGRPGYEAIGVSASGAFDRGSLALANRLVANTERAAGLELLLGGLRVKAHGDLMVALAGAPAPATVNGIAVGHAAVVMLRDGAELAVGTPRAGLRTYLAVHGGVDVPPVLGSRSRDTLAGIGPPPVAAGDLLPVGPSPARFPCVDLAPVKADGDGDVVLPLLAGPRADWVEGDALSIMSATRWTVLPASDRVALRLDGPPLNRARKGELPPEGLVPGAVQIPPDGRPILFGADAGVTGGYPVVAVVAAHALDRAAQLRPGETLRFCS